MTGLSELSETRKLLAGGITALAILAVCLSSYLTWVTWQQSTVAGCTGASAAGCDEVLTSSGSKWLGIPVSLLGALTYAGIAVVVWPAVLWGGSAMTLLLTLSVLAAGAGMWFIGAQALVIQHFCLYCMTIHLCGLLICGASFLLLRMTATDPDYDHMRVFFGAEDYVQQSASFQDAYQPLIAAGLASVGLLVLIVGQVFFAPAGMEVVENVPMEIDSQPVPETLQPAEPPAEVTEPAGEAVVVTDQDATGESEAPDQTATDTVSESPDPLEEASSDAEEEVAFDLFKEPETESNESSDEDSLDSLFADQPVSQETAKQVVGEEATAAKSSSAASRRFRFKFLRREIDVQENPVIGNPYAEQRLVEMLDYTCPHCRKLHPFIHKAVERYGDQVGFVIYHVPLSRKCNPLVRVDQTTHRNACEYAKLAYGVWKLQPEKFAEYHDWLMEGEKVPSLYDAKTRAMHLVGEAILMDKLIEPESRKRVADSAAELEVFKVGLPVLIFNEGIVKGLPDSEKEWFKLFEEKLGLRPLATASN